MVASVEDRLTELELEIRALSHRLAAVEGAAPPPRVTRPAPTAVRPQPTARVEPAAPALPPAPRAAVVPSGSSSAGRDLEELLGGRLLALVGGLAVLVGLLFLVALALDRGWIDERARIALALLGSGALLGVGAWLHERRGRTQASLAAVGTGIAGLYLSFAAATSLYALVPAPLALVAALGVGALAATLAVRWSSRTVAGLGIFGALVTPALVDATATAAGIAFLAVAFAASTAVLVWKRWEWLRVGAFALTMLQVAVWALAVGHATASIVLVLALFGVLGLGAALGFELRVPPRVLRLSTSFLVGANALVVGGIGFLALEPAHGLRGGGIWMGALALGHVAAALAALRVRRIGPEVSVLLFGVALTAGDIAFALLVDGPALAVGWAVSAVVLALVARVVGSHGELAQATLAGQLTLAIAHTLVFDAPPDALVAGGSIAWAPLVAVGLSAFTCARLARGDAAGWRILADGVALLTLAYTTALALDGPALVATWVGESLVLGGIARRGRERLAAIGSVSFLGLAALHALAYEAPPDALVLGVASLVEAAFVLIAVAGAAAALAHRGLGFGAPERPALALAAGAAVVYLASVAIVDAFQPGTAAFESDLGLTVGQQGQALLTAFWSSLGLALLWVGLRGDLRVTRLTGFGLLGVAVAKAFLFDMSALDSGYRVLSFIVLGLLLLSGAYAYQRIRGGEATPAT
jgi:uncharacterized membrane protein